MSNTMNMSQKIKSGANRKNNSRAGANIDSSGDQIVKRMTFTGDVLSTGAGTVILVTTVGSGAVFTVPAAEWASFSARYQQYRVRKIVIRGKAINPVQSATITHSALYRGDFIGNATPASAAQVFSDENMKICTTCEDFVDVVTWERNPNARLWNPTTAAIPIANSFSWVCASPATPALTTATTYYALTLEWEVEFRGSQ
jgi:hypothetical protein